MATTAGIVTSETRRQLCRCTVFDDRMNSQGGQLTGRHGRTFRSDPFRRRIRTRSEATVWPIHTSCHASVVTYQKPSWWCGSLHCLKHTINSSALLFIIIEKSATREHSAHNVPIAQNKGYIMITSPETPASTIQRNSSVAGFTTHTYLMARTLASCLLQYNQQTVSFRLHKTTHRLNQS